MLHYKAFYACCLGFVISFATTASGQQHQIVEIIAPGQLIGPYESYPTESHVVIEDRLIEDRLIDERLLIEGFLQGQIIQNSVPLASERIDLGTSVVASDVHDVQATSSAAIATITATAANDQGNNRHGEAIAEMAQRSVKLEEKLAGLKQVLQTHMETAGEQQAAVAAKLAEAIKQRDDARTQFEASLKEYSIRNEQVVTLAVGLREAYDRLEAKRVETGDASEKSMAMVSELQKQIARIESEFIKAGESIKVAVAETNVISKKLNLQFSENAGSVDSLKKTISTLEDRVKALEKNRGKAKPKKND